MKERMPSPKTPEPMPERPKPPENKPNPLREKKRMVDLPMPGEMLDLEITEKIEQVRQEIGKTEWPKK